MVKKLTVPDLLDIKASKKRITMMTAHDYSSGMLVQEAEIDMILVGDSLAMTVLGYESTVSVTMDEMLHHTKAVVRGAPDTFVAADMPFGSFNVTNEDTIINATRFLKEGGADAVKLEGGVEAAEAVKAVVKAGIPVLGHIGLTPQTAVNLGGYKVQGRNEPGARKIIEDAKALDKAGAFAVVLECIPLELAEEITGILSIPTIGIGAGPYCNGQVLVYNDAMGLFKKFTPKFVKRYSELGEETVKGLKRYKEEVEHGVFPNRGHSFE